jgi:hypothetical protein
MARVFTLAASSVMSAEGLIHSGEPAVKVARSVAKRVESRPRVFEHHVKGGTIGMIRKSALQIVASALLAFME